MKKIEFLNIKRVSSLLLCTPYGPVKQIIEITKKFGKNLPLTKPRM